jgi:hypothetical protein
MSGDKRQRGVEAVFELDYIVGGGHAREKGTKSPPRGLQLQLAAHHGKPIDGTLIVENLGYLQFKLPRACIILRYARDAGVSCSRWKAWAMKGGSDRLSRKPGMKLP